MPKRNHSCTLEEVAREAGVSKMTASRALRNTGRVSAATIDRVTSVADRLGYRPNPLVQTLMAGVRRKRIEQSVNIAWISTYPEAGLLPAPIQKIAAGARQRANMLGYELDTVPIHTSESTTKSIKRILESRGIRAAIIAPLQHPGEIPQFPYESFAVATIGRSLLSPALHYTMAHQLHAMNLMLRQLESRGYQRIAFLLDSEMNTRSEYTTQMTFEHYCLQRGINPKLAVQCYDGWKSSDYAKWFLKFKPEAIIVDFPKVTRFLSDSGIAIGSELGLATMSYDKKFPHCSGIRQPFQALGSGAVDMVVAQLHRNERGTPEHPKAMLFEGDWIEGRTLLRR